jgi:anti-anti-sigma factor
VAQPERLGMVPMDEQGWRASLGAGLLRCEVVVLEPDQLVLRVAGEVDLATAPGLRIFLRDEGSRAVAGSRVVLDCAGIEFFSAAGVRVLSAASEHCRARGVTLILDPVSEVVAVVLAATDCDGLLAVPGPTP